MWILLISVITYTNAQNQGVHLSHHDNPLQFEVIPLTHIPFYMKSALPIIRFDEINEVSQPFSLLFSQHQDLQKILFESYSKGCKALITFDDISGIQLPFSFPIFKVIGLQGKQLQAGLILNIENSNTPNSKPAIELYINPRHGEYERKLGEIVTAILNVPEFNTEISFGLHDNQVQGLNQYSMCILQLSGQDPQHLASILHNQPNIQGALHELMQEIHEKGEESLIQNCLNTYIFPSRPKSTLIIGGTEYQGIDWHVFIEHDIRKALSLEIRPCSPDCSITNLLDTKCDQVCNTKSCFFDMSICSTSRHLCSQSCQDYWKNDGICDEDCNTEACGYDFGDCTCECPENLLGDGVCNEECNKSICNYDEGDCSEQERFLKSGGRSRSKSKSSSSSSSSSGDLDTEGTIILCTILVLGAIIVVIVYLIRRWRRKRNFNGENGLDVQAQGDQQPQILQMQPAQPTFPIYQHDDKPPMQGDGQMYPINQPPYPMYPNQPPYQMYPNQPPYQMYPNQPPQQMYPNQPPQQMYPNQPPQQMYPNQPPNQMYPNAPPNQMYPNQPQNQMYPNQSPYPDQSSNQHPDGKSQHIYPGSQNMPNQIEIGQPYSGGEEAGSDQHLYSQVQLFYYNFIQYNINQSITQQIPIYTKILTTETIQQIRNKPFIQFSIDQHFVQQRQSNQSFRINNSVNYQKMGRKEIRVVQWKEIYLLQFALFSCGMNITVIFNQYICPIVFYFSQELTDDTFSALLGAGALLSAHQAGRLISWPIWHNLQSTCNRRQSIHIGLLLGAILTFSLGFSRKLIYAVAVRALAGAFCPVVENIKVTHKQRLSKEYSLNCYEDYPKVVKINLVFYTLGTFAGFLVGGLLSFPAVSGVINESPNYGTHPFLLPSFVAAILMFMSFVILSTKLEDPKRPLLPPPTRPQQDMPMPVRPNNYAELSEEAKEVAESGPVTERRENPGQEEEYPNFLQVQGIGYVVQISDDEEEGEGTESARDVKHVRFFSPRNIAREGPVVRELQSARHSSRQQSGFEDYNAHDSNEINSNNTTITPQDVKCTHISFIEEDFEEPSTEIGPTPPPQDIQLEDEFPRIFVQSFFKSRAAV